MKPYAYDRRDEHGSIQLHQSDEAPRVRADEKLIPLYSAEQADGMLEYRYHEWYLDVLKAAMETPDTDAYLSQLRNEARAEIAVMMDGHAARYDALAKQVEDYGVDNRYRSTAAMFRGVAKELRECKAGEVCGD